MTLFSQLVDFYQDIGFPMTHAEGTTILSARYQGKNALWTFIASSDEDNRILIMFARAPEPCPPERMAEMSAFLERSNFGMTHGAWVMDRDDGEIRFRVGVDLQHLQLYDDYIRSLTLYTQYVSPTSLHPACTQRQVILANPSKSWRVLVNPG